MLVPELFIRRTSRHAPWTYRELDAFQKQIFRRVLAGGRGALIFSELEPVITVGRRTAEADVYSEKVERYPVARGGLATYHGPGQWVVFAVDRLDRLVGDIRGVRKTVDGLLDSALEVGARFRARVWKGAGAELGAWSDRGKFAAVGIQVSERVVQHGLAVNGFATPESFEGLRPCGLDQPVDFLRDTPDEEEFCRLRGLIEDSLRRRFWLQQHER